MDTIVLRKFLGRGGKLLLMGESERRPRRGRSEGEGPAVAGARGKVPKRPERGSWSRRSRSDYTRVWRDRGEV